jgi:AbrB family looped-hinge helix DNA binding protein
LRGLPAFALAEHGTPDPAWQAAVRRYSRRAAFEQSLDRIAHQGYPYYRLFRKDLETTMSTDSTLTSKGQTTIPKAIRDSLKMKTGDRITFTLMPDGVVLMRVKNKRVADLAGLLHKKGRKPVPVEMLSR